MIEQIIKYEDRIAAVDDNIQLTYAELCNEIFHAMGDINQKEIAICMQHNVIYMVYMLAAIEKGIRVHLLSPTAKKDTLNYLNEKKVDIYVDIDTRNRFFANYESDNIVVVERMNVDKMERITDSFISEDAKASIVLSTSGTTSKRTKLVDIPFNNIWLKAHMISEHFKIDENDRTLCLSPLCFVQSVWTILIHLINGASIYFANFEADKFDYLLETYNITTVVTVPSVIRGIIDNNKSSYSLRLLSIGGDYMDERLLGKLKIKWPNVCYVNVYGATETCAADTIFDPIPFGEMDDSFFTLGKPTEYSKVFITSEDGRILGSEEIGNICIQSPFLIDHYFNLELDIRNENGYFETYDKGYIDKMGRLHYCGRSNSIIVYNGKKISACEVENVIYNYPGILEVVVIGKNHDIYGQVPVAYIVCTGNVQKDELEEYLRSELEKYKIPREIVFVDKLRKTISGKVIRDSVAYE